MGSRPVKHGPDTLTDNAACAEGPRGRSGCFVASDVVTVAELAEWWRTSTDVVRGQVRRGEIPFFRVGRLIRFHVPLLLDWMGQCNAARTDSAPEDSDRGR